MAKYITNATVRIDKRVTVSAAHIVDSALKPDGNGRVLVYGLDATGEFGSFIDDKYVELDKPVRPTDGWRTDVFSTTYPRHGTWSWRIEGMLDNGFLVQRTVDGYKTRDEAQAACDAARAMWDDIIKRDNQC